MAEAPSRKHRFFVEDLRKGQIALPTTEAHHAIHVLRLGVGATVELLDGKGRAGGGEIVRIEKRRPIVEVRRLETAADRPTPIIHLGFAVPKGKRLDWLLEKTTELGAASLRPIAFDRSVAGSKPFSAARRDRWRSHCIAAAKQSGLNFLPDINDPLGLDEFVSRWQETDVGTLLVGDTADRTAPLIELLSPTDSEIPNTICVLVGPEGGLTEAERELLTQAGARTVRVGESTLRVETAAIALLAGITVIHQSAR